MSSNNNLHKAKSVKNDEFYTQLCDVENELAHYKAHFKGKVVYCNCDDRWSSFFKYFRLNFHHLGLKKLVATHYRGDGLPSYMLEVTGDDPNAPPVCRQVMLKGDGDFRSEECLAILEESDIVVTNPPFSLFREFLATILEHGKKFLCIESLTAVGYKEVFPLLRANRVWLGHNHVKEFLMPDGFKKKFGNILWYTNLDHSKRNEMIPLYRTYNPESYPKYDNLDAIEVRRTSEIPVDYDGVMGVPISFMERYNPAQFEIVGYRKGSDGKDLCVNGKDTFNRILIRRLVQ